jgi:hypothetical protein
MTPPEDEGVRTRLLLTACGFSVAALAAIGGLLLLGLHRPKHQPVVFAPPRPQVRSAASVDRGAPGTGAGQARRTAARRAEAIAAEPGGQARRTAARRAEAIAANTQDQRLFSSMSIWNQRVAPGAPLDPSSGMLVANLVAEVGRERTAGTGPLIQAGRASTPLYRVGAAQARVRVGLDDRQVPGHTALRRALAAVPIPANAKAGAKPNRYMSIWQPARDTLWELRGARKVGHEWHASWGGAMRKASKNRGYYTPAAWRGATQTWGVTPSSLPAVAGAILADDLRSGRIDHALAINVPASRAGVFTWPAQRTDGDGGLPTLPLGAHVRLAPDVDVKSLRLPRLTRMIAEAAQRYGLVVRGQDRAIALVGESPQQVRKNPYRKYFLGRTSQQLLANFPWDRLQVLQMHLCTSAPCAPPSQ